jgi:hypothetical protein
VVAGEGDDLAEDEGFAEKVVCAERTGLFDGVWMGGADGDAGVGRRGGAVGGKEVATVHDGHEQVEDDQRGAVTDGELEGDGAVGGGDDGVAFGFQGLDEETADVLLVFDDEDGVCARGPVPGRTRFGG